MDQFDDYAAAGQHHDLSELAIATDADQDFRDGLFDHALDQEIAAEGLRRARGN